MNLQAHNSPPISFSQPAQTSVSALRTPGRSKPAIVGILLFLGICVCIGFGVGGFILGWNMKRCEDGENNTRWGDEKYYSCVQDSDCIIVQDGCCSCGNGGQNTSINRDYEGDWENDILTKCSDTYCLTWVSDHWTCNEAEIEAKCIESECELKEKVSDDVDEITSEEDCEAAGGSWEVAGISGEYFCNEVTADAGDKCYNGSECEGSCIIDEDDLTQEQRDRLEKNESISTHGYCSNRKMLYGCYYFVEAGLVDGMLCID